MQKKPLETQDQNHQINDDQTDNQKKEESQLPAVTDLKEQQDKKEAEETEVLKENIKGYNEQLNKDLNEDKDRNSGANKTSGKFESAQDLE